MSNTPKRKSKAGTRTAPTRARTATPQQAGSPWPTRFAYLGGAAVVAVIMAAIFLGGGDEDLPDGPPDGVQFIDPGDPVHIDGPIAYDVAVPVGGAHNAVWQNCGFYEGAVRTENVLHALEHGVIWITYRQDLGGDRIDDLRGLIRNRTKVLVSEVPDQPAPLMATAWGIQLELDVYDDVALRRFMKEFTDGPFAPEPGASCTGGVGNPA